MGFVCVRTEHTISAIMISSCPQGSSWSSRTRNSTKCPVPRGPAGTGSSSTPWSTTPPWWAPGSTSSIRPRRAFWMEASTTAARRQRRLPATECMWPHKEGSLFVQNYCRCVCIRPNKCTYSSVPYVEMFSEPSLSEDRVFTSCPVFVCAWGLTGLTGKRALWRWLPAQAHSLISHSILFRDSSSLLHVPTGTFLCYYHIVQIMQVYSYLN